MVCVRREGIRKGYTPRDQPLDQEADTARTAEVPHHCLLLTTSPLSPHLGKQRPCFSLCRWVMQVGAIFLWQKKKDLILQNVVNHQEQISFREYTIVLVTSSVVLGFTCKSGKIFNRIWSSDFKIISNLKKTGKHSLMIFPPEPLKGKLPVLIALSPTPRPLPTTRNILGGDSPTGTSFSTMILQLSKAQKNDLDTLWPNNLLIPLT